MLVSYTPRICAGDLYLECAFRQLETVAIPEHMPFGEAINSEFSDDTEIELEAATDMDEDWTELHVWG
jgi:hypothetical protein